METKKEKKPRMVSTQSSELIEKPEQHSGRTIIVRTVDKNDNSANYIINIDGQVLEGNGTDDKNIHIHVLVFTTVTWTQMNAMINVIKNLKSNGAGKVKRYDEFKSGLINPSFNLAHVLTKYSVR